LNDEILLQLEHGQARRVPKTLLVNACALVDLDLDTVAKCFAPRIGSEVRMAAHDQSGSRPEAQPVCDFLIIIEDSALSDVDKEYWRMVVQTEVSTGVSKE